MAIIHDCVWESWHCWITRISDAHVPAHGHESSAVHYVHMHAFIMTSILRPDITSAPVLHCTAYPGQYKSLVMLKGSHRWLKPDALLILKNA
mmetsp:Transcript_3424/g.7462  ORF Transcript_3424/g.7462 Transcript_3424/m.7462 type:complete len:92 (-) Transcript_3424:309-584(-)